MSANLAAGKLPAGVRADLRRAIATDIYRVAERSPMTLVADGGELATVLAERIIRRVEEGDTTDDHARR